MVEHLPGQDQKELGENVSVGSVYETAVEGLVKVATLHWVPESVLTVSSGGSSNSHLQKMDQAMLLGLMASIEPGTRPDFPQV